MKYLINKSLKQAIPLYVDDSDHREKLWNHVLNSGLRWDFKSDEIKFYIGNRDPVKDGNYEDLSYIYEDVFPDEMVVKEDQDVMTIGNDLIVIYKRKTPDELKKMTVAELKKYAKNLKEEAKSLMCPKVPYSKFKKSELIELIIICKNLKNYEKEEKLQKKLQKEKKDYLLKEVKKMKLETNAKYSCVEHYFNMRKQELINSILKCQNNVLK